MYINTSEIILKHCKAKKTSKQYLIWALQGKKLLMEALIFTKLLAINVSK